MDFIKHYDIVVVHKTHGSDRERGILSYLEGIGANPIVWYGHNGNRERITCKGMRPGAVANHISRLHLFQALRAMDAESALVVEEDALPATDSASSMPFPDEWGEGCILNYAAQGLRNGGQGYWQKGRYWWQLAVGFDRKAIDFMAGKLHYIRKNYDKQVASIAKEEGLAYYATNRHWFVQAPGTQETSRINTNIL